MKRFTSNRASTSASAQPGYVLVVKWDVFRAVVVEQCAAAAFPGARVICCHNAEDALAHLRREPAWLAVLGLTLPDLDGIDLVGLVVREHLAARVLIATDRKDERARALMHSPFVHGAFDTGSEPPSLLVRVMKSVAGIGYYRSGSIRRDDGQSRSVARLLTPRELKVFAAIADGTDDASAGAVLGLSPHTIHTHREHIMRKLNAPTRTDLMREAMRRGFLRIVDGRTLHPGSDHESPDGEPSEATGSPTK